MASGLGCPVHSGGNPYAPPHVLHEHWHRTGAPSGASVSLNPRQNRAHVAPPVPTCRMTNLATQQYLTDPRRLIADFYRGGDSSGPAGSVKAKGAMATVPPASSWFAVYRPCSRDSISKMLGQVGVGKGLNIKGKPAQIEPYPYPYPSPYPLPLPLPLPLPPTLTRTRTLTLTLSRQVGQEEQALRLRPLLPDLKERAQGRAGERAERRAHAHLL